MVKLIFLTAESLLFLLFLIPVFSGILNPGNIAGMLVSVILILVTFFFDKFKSFCIGLFAHTGGKIAVISVSTLIAAGFIYVLVLSVFMICAQLKSPENAQAVVVLGCKVNGETPSRMLARRLDSAYEFLHEKDDVICIVSGGKGDDEKISEALAMKRYLVNKGIDSDRIIMEDNSETTYENIKFSSDILHKHNITDIAIVTDGFHQYRAGRTAEKYGLYVSAVNAENDSVTLPLIPTYWVREWMAITKDYIS